MTSPAMTSPASSGPATTRPADFHTRAVDALHAAILASRAESDPEDAVRHFTRATRALLGKPGAAEAPGALKPGETQFIVSGCFFITPLRDSMILLADHGFPAAQRHARISVTDSRPGHAVQTKTPAVVPNTDVDPIFRQILSSGVVGCSVYVPVFWGDEVVGMFNTAAQARYMYDETDLAVQVLFANAAIGAWIAKGGPDKLARLAAELGPFTG
ncbi:GAF domain-containing protein [Acuticoccus sp. I52.16.1]|uniref:GAF domain-containing protein n=1 Tax=Acuticoccus sp. I52.16.1 TaxID=2928472 RepID=UPI001FD19DCC|nr:GAF domain-containing protein [Acuticoccus sp. I52.16.1]UOM34236.1 GAF domain-containing protein [Acuticoccus sp. I52.16.1]